MVKSAHKEQNSGDVMDNYVNVVMKEEENLELNITKFFERINIKLEEIINKKDADGYLDMIRGLKSLKFEG